MSELDLGPDVLVVGGGVAGALAAARAREQGARVTLVHRPGGGTSSSSGAVDVADDLTGLVPGGALDPFDRGGRWRRAADVVAARQPRHPYARCGDKARERLREAMSLLKQLAGDVELVERDDGQNHVVLTQLGTVKRAAFVQKSQLLDLASLQLGGGDDVLVGIVEPMDLAGFSARSVVHMLSWILGLSKAGADKRVQLTTVVVERTLPGREVYGSPFEMASRLDDPPTRAAFIEALKAALRKQTRPPAHLLLPPILGIEKSAAALADLERALARPVREMLALPGSAPGERLQRALIASVRKKGVAVLEGAAVQGSVADRRASAVVVEGRQLRVELKPKTVILAGGRFFGGGITRDGVARETLFGLPVMTGGNLVGDSFIGDHLGDGPDGEHPIFRAGVAVDQALRPLDPSGSVALENVLCAGSVVEGWDPARDGTGAGVAALTGFLAGERAAKMVKGQ